MTSEEKQVWADEVRELDESSAKEKQLIEEVPLKKDFIETQT